MLTRSPSPLPPAGTVVAKDHDLTNWIGGNVWSATFLR